MQLLISERNRLDKENQKLAKIGLAYLLKFGQLPSHQFYSTIKKRRNFSKNTKKAVLLNQVCRCKSCFIFLEFPEFHHMNRDRSNNFIWNCEALCPNCHTRRTKAYRLSWYGLF